MAHLDLHAKAEIGKSLAGFALGEKLQSFLHYVDESVDGNKVPWNVDLVNNNEGVLLYKWGSSYGNGYAIFFKNPTLELSFSEQGTLIFIEVGEGYQGEIFDGGIKIGSRIGDIDHALVLDDTEDAHYLADDKGQFIDGIFFLAGGEEVIDNPDATIGVVRVYNYNFK